MPLGLDTLNPATLLSGRYRQEQIPDLSGRVAIVTGGSAGIGYNAALALARAGADVMLVSSHRDKGKAAAEDIAAYLREHDPNGKSMVRWDGCQLADLKDVDRFSKEILERLERLDILIHNAGIGQVPWSLTEDGLESHFEVNDLAPWLMTMRLLPLMRKTAEMSPPGTVRIVMQSSELHRAAPSNTAFLSRAEINEKRDGTLLYGRSKLGLVLLARQLAKRPDAQGIVVTSVHPGTVDTEIQDAWGKSYGVAGKATAEVMRLIGKSAAEGAEASLWAATCPDITSENLHEYQGNYYSEAYGKPGTESDQAKNEALGDQFWALCRAEASAVLGEEVD